jgi:transcriptional regulator
MEMYIPKTNILADKSEAVSFMKRFSFATVITSKDNIPVATHLPFIIEERNDTILLTSHFARANAQWKQIEANRVLVIFSEPHAYISPKHYEQELNVPTWNYISVHCYGKGRLIIEEEKVMQLLERTVANYDDSFIEQYQSLPEDYKTNLAKGVIAFEIEVVEMQAKKKLSQNKSEVEQRNIINSLSLSDQTNEKLIADYMEKELRLNGDKPV